ncbi:MAG: SGNH/GDSL hydrolase family protein [Clostridia bacterium]
MLFEKNTSFLMVGDSITDCGRDRATPDKLTCLGDGYVQLFAARFQAEHPEYNLRVINKGVSADTTRELKARWQQDVLDDDTADYLSVMIGINDVMHQFDRPYLPQSHVGVEEYSRNLNELIASAQNKFKKIILLTPHYLEPNHSDPLRREIALYQSVMHAIAVQYGCLFVDTQQAFDLVLAHQYPAWMAWDRVHPNLIGHFIIMEALWKAVH